MSLNWVRNLSLNLKLNILVVIVLVTLLLLTIWVTTASIRNFTLLLGQQNLSAEVESMQNRFGETEEGLVRDLRLLANTPSLLEAFIAEDENALRRVSLTSKVAPNLDDILIVDLSGNPRFNRDDDLKLSQAEEMLSLALIGIEVTAPIVDEDADTFRIGAAIPLSDPTDASRIGAIVATREIDDAFLANFNFNRAEPHVVLLSKDRVLAEHILDDHHHEEAEGHDEDEAAGHSFVGLVNEGVIARALAGEIVLQDEFIVESGENDPHFVAYFPLVIGGETEAVMAIVTNLNNFSAFQNELLTEILGIVALLTIAAIAGLALFSWRSISRPIIALDRAVQQMMTAEKVEQIPVNSTDELGRLAQTFNTMSQNLNTSIRQLNVQSERLNEQSLQMGLVTTINERLSTFLRIDELLAEIVNQINDNFGYYHTHIYLFDEKRDNLVVAEGVGSAGAEMKATGHAISLDTGSLVARAARRGEIVRVDDVRENSEWLPNPLLPDTQAEMAVPIKLDDEVVGVLDVQEKKVAGFDEVDEQLLLIVAGQAAIAIRNAHLFESVETALAEAERTQQQYFGEVWDRSRLARSQSEYLHTRPGAAPLDETQQHHLAAVRQQALSQDQSSLIVKDEIFNTEAVVAPIEVGQKKIGAMHLQPSKNRQGWSKEDLAIVEAVIDQFTQTVENLRLFDETRERASREQSIREITDKLRAAPNLQRLLEIATDELGQRLGATHGSLRLGIQDKSQKNGTQ